MARPREVTDEQILAAARRSFLEKGAGTSTHAIAEDLGVSHTTIFNRFGSKEALMLAALGPPETLIWAQKLSDGPDERPIQEQLIEIGAAISDYFRELQAGISVLRAAGISMRRLQAGRKKPTPVQAFEALSGWLDRAQKQGRIAHCDIEILTTTILGSLHNFAFTNQICGRNLNSTDYVRGFFELLFQGIKPTETKGKKR